MKPKSTHLHASGGLLEQIDADASSYADFLAQMLAAVHVATIPDGDHAGARPLASLSRDENGNWVMALVKAWAAVGDILAFYQARLLNEGFLFTALERRSITELVRLLGYQVSPGVGARVDLCFNVTETPGVQGDLVVPRGTQVLSVGAGKQPQVFETSQDLTVRGEWSKAAVAPLTAPATITDGPDPGTLRLYVAGTETGLSAGDYILLMDSSLEPGAPAGAVLDAAHFPKLAKVQPNVSLGYTQLIWPSAQPDAGRAAVKPDFQVFAFRRQASLFGYNAPAWQSLPVQAKLQNGATLGGGVVRTPADLKSWTPVNQGLPAPDPAALPSTAILAASNGVLWTAPQTGVYSFRGQGPWSLSANGITAAGITALGEGPQGALYAGAMGAVFRSADGGDTWQPMDGVVSVVAGKQGSSATWTPTSTKFPRVVVHCFLATPSAVSPAKVYAGTDGGVLESSTAGGGWTPHNTGLGDLDPTTGMSAIAVYNLAFTADGKGMWAATSQGVFHAKDASSGWVASNHGLKGLVYALLVTGASSLACAGDGGVYRSADSGATWQPVNLGLPTTDAASGFTAAAVSALAAGASGILFAATPYGVYQLAAGAKSWARVGPDGVGALFRVDAGLKTSLDGSQLTPAVTQAFAVAGVKLGAHSTVSVLTPGSSWLVAAAPEGPVFSLRSNGPAIDVAPAAVASLVIGADGALTLLTPSSGVQQDEWPGFAITGANVDLDSVNPRILVGSWIVLQHDAPDGASQAGLYPVRATPSVSRQDFWLRAEVTRLVTAPDSTQLLNSFPLRGTTVYVQSDELLRAELPVPCVKFSRAGTLELNVTMKQHPEKGRRVVVSGKTTAPEPPSLPASAPATRQGAGAEQIMQVPLDRSRLYSVVCQVSSVKHTSAEVVEITLQTHDPADFDPSTLNVHGNVASATQGETVRNELLGSGNAAAAHQIFALKKGPLVYQVDPDKGVHDPSLQVSVNGVLWQRVSSFEEHGPAGEVYVTKLDEKGYATVQFGDGMAGARLPTGVDNVTATYRVADTSQGTVEAGNIFNLRGRPLGVRSVANLHSATPQPPESNNQAARRAPASTRPLSRVVSVRDYQDVAAIQPYVSKAQARWMRAGHRRGVHLTVALAPDSSDLLDALTALIVSREATPALLAIQEYGPVPLAVSARIHVASGSSPDDTSKAVAQALEAAFSLDRRDFAQDVQASEVLAAIQSVAGVAGAVLTALARQGQPPASAIPDVLVAAPARWSPAGFTPAELLLITADSPIDIQPIP